MRRAADPSHHRSTVLRCLFRTRSSISRMPSTTSRMPSTTRTARQPSGFAAAALFALMTALVLIAAPAWAQGTAPGAAAAPPQAPAEMDAAENDAAETPGAKTGPPLPPGYEAPRPVPPQMTLSKPLMTAEEAQAESNALQIINPRAVLTGGQLTGEARQQITRWARLNFAQMTLATDAPEKIADITRDMTRALRSSGTRQSNENREREFREYVADQVIAEGKKVFDNNFFVRLQAVILISRLNSLEESLQKRRPALGYVKAIEPLLDILEGDQLPALKVAAAAGIARLGSSSESIPAELRFRAGKVLVAELAKKETYWWYQMRLAEALAAVNLAYDRNRKPVTYDALLSVISDPQRHCRARAAAAKAMARISLPPEADLAQLGAQLTQAAAQMATAFNQAPARADWWYCFIDLELAFKPSPGEDVPRLPQDSLLRRGTLAAPLEAAFGRILPVAKHVLAQPDDTRAQPVPANLIKALTAITP